MTKELYERLEMDVTQFDIEDVITTSGITPTPSDPEYVDDGIYGLPLSNYPGDF